MTMKVRELFDLSSELINEARYMMDNFTEVDKSLDEIPDKTLDDIIDEIKQEDQPEEPVEENTDTEEDEPIEEDTGDEPEPEPQPEPSTMDICASFLNIQIVEKNALYNNAVIDKILDEDATNIQNKNVLKACVGITDVLHNIYDVLGTVTKEFLENNTNNRSKFIIISYRTLTGLSNLIQNIYDELNSKSYLACINGPIEKDYTHWFSVEVQECLTTINQWDQTPDLKKLDIIDEAIQFDLKYAALLKKLVISEFKGFDDYYDNLFKYLMELGQCVEDYMPPYHNYETGREDKYDPIAITKASKISMTFRTHWPPEPEE